MNRSRHEPNLSFADAIKNVCHRANWNGLWKARSGQMKMTFLRHIGTPDILVGLTLFTLSTLGADKQAIPESAARQAACDLATPAETAGVLSDDITQLKVQLAAQQKQIAAQQEQIDRLIAGLEAQEKLVTRSVGSSPEEKRFVVSPPFAKLGEVASISGVVPTGSVTAAQVVNPVPPPSDTPAPLSFKIGSTYLTPVGFIDVTYVGRSTNVGSGIGTNFASIPFSNVPQGRLTDGLLSLQNSRIGARFDAIVHRTKVLAYWESDFLGSQPTNILVSTDSDTLRLRLIWVDLKRDKCEFLGGQSWSLITPNRKGISPLPSDVFYSLVVDTNYQVGIPWGRIPSVRFVFHPTDEVAWAVAAENAQQYIGGSAGGGLVTLPNLLVIPLNNQLNNGTNSFSVPSVNPDIISKIAFDPVANNRLLHFEIAGMLRTFRIFNSLNNQHFATVGGAGSFNSNLELIPGGRLRLIENFFYGRGVGRWLFGQGPDLIVNSNGALGLLPGGATAAGFESQVTKNLFLYSYYGAQYFGRGVAIDTNGKPVGYGFTGSPNNNNRTIQEVTIGLQNTFWKDPRWGSLQFFLQYSYLFRTPWFVATGTPSQAQSHMVFLNLRYGFPGEAPNLK
jgi:hypothetical protein